MNSKGEIKEDEKPSQNGTKHAHTEQTVLAYAALPVDGGWGWVVVAASFFCNLMVDGYTYSVGVFLGKIAESLHASKAKTAFMGSLLSGFCLMSGPFVSALANRYGFRTVCIIGSVFACLSFATASMGNSIEYLCITYGVLGGIGLGLVYVPAVLTVGFYFNKWRTLATSIAVCGSGIGTCIVAPIVTQLIDTFGWRGAILIQAGVILNCAVFGASFRPLPPTEMAVETVEEDEDFNVDEDVEDENRDTVTSNKLPILMKIKHAREELKRADSKLSFDNEISITAQPPRDIKRFLKAGHNMKYATVREVLNDSRETVQNLFQSNNSLNKPQTNKIVKNRGRFDIITYKDKKINGVVQRNANGTKLTDQELDDLQDESLIKRPYTDTYYKRTSIHRLAAAAAILEACDARRNSVSLRYHPRARTASDCSAKSGQRSRRNTISAGVRPFYRDDIFYQANPSRLPQYPHKGTGDDELEYTMAVTRLPTVYDVLEEESSQCTLCPEAVQRTLATMLDISLMTSPSFLLLCISGFFTMMGFLVPFTYLQDRAQTAGMDMNLAQWLLSTIGVANTFGRIICGVVTSLPSVNALALTNASLTVGGIATMLSGLSMSNTYQFTYAAVFGLSISAFASMRSIIVCDLVGLENLTNAFGLLLMFQGVAAVIGSPTAGFFMEITNDYNIAFVLSGGLILLSSVMCYPLNWVNKWEKRRNARNQMDDNIKDEAV